MAGFSVKKDTNTTFNSESILLDPVQTTDATPVLVYTVSIPQNKTYDINVYIMAIKSDGLTRNCGFTRGIFSRGTGNISQEGTLAKDLIGILSTSQVQYTINNTNFTVEVYAKGLAATTINWDFSIQIKNKV